MKRIFLILFILLGACTIKQNRGFYFTDKDKVENFDVYNFTNFLRRVLELALKLGPD